MQPPVADVRINIPTEIINRSKCSLCENLLTVAPITVISEDGKEYKCGRCTAIENKINIPSEALENILKHLLLPCTYGCPQKLSWENVEGHEENCRGRQLQCPLYYRNCNSMVKVSKLEEHFSQKHVNNIKLGNVITYNLEVDHSIVLLTLTGDEVFLVYLFVYEDFFSFTVFSIYPLKKYIKFDLKMSSDNGNASVTYENMQIVHYNERMHCYRCMESECHLDYHPFSEKYNKPQTNRIHIPELKGTSIKNLLGHPGMIQFFITLRTEDEPMEVASRPKNHKNGILRKSFECPICHEYMQSPIYCCSTGHSVCSVCRLWLERCPTCEAPFEESRNYALEVLAETVELPCQSEDKGCDFLGNVEDVRKHELVCVYKLQN